MADISAYKQPTPTPASAHSPEPEASEPVASGSAASPAVPSVAPSDPRLRTAPPNQDPVENAPLPLAGDNVLCQSGQQDLESDAKREVETTIEHPVQFSPTPTSKRLDNISETPPQPNTEPASQPQPPPPSNSQTEAALSPPKQSDSQSQASVPLPAIPSQVVGEHQVEAPQAVLSSGPSVKPSSSQTDVPPRVPLSQPQPQPQLQPQPPAETQQQLQHGSLSQQPDAKQHPTNAVVPIPRQPTYVPGPIPRNLPKTAKRRPKNARVFVGNLASEFTSVDEMIKIFYKYGELIEEPVLRRSFGFIQYASAESASSAVVAEQGRIIGGIAIDLSIADNREVKRGTHVVNNTPFPHGPKGAKGLPVVPVPTTGPPARSHPRDAAAPHPPRKRRRSLSPNSGPRKSIAHAPQYRGNRPEPRGGTHMRVLCMSPTARAYARQCEHMFRSATGLTCEVVNIVASGLGDALGRAMREMIPYVMVVASKDVEDGTCTIRTLERTGYEKAGRGNGIIPLREAIDVCLIDRGLAPAGGTRGAMPAAMGQYVPNTYGSVQMPNAPSWGQGSAAGQGLAPGVNRKPGWMSGPRAPHHPQRGPMPQNAGYPMSGGSVMQPQQMHNPQAMPPHHSRGGRSNDSRPSYDRMDGPRQGSSYAQYPPHQQAPSDYGYGAGPMPNMNQDNRMGPYMQGAPPPGVVMPHQDYGQGRYSGPSNQMGHRSSGRDVEYDPAAVMPGGRPDQASHGWGGDSNYNRNQQTYGMGGQGPRQHMDRGRDSFPQAGRHGTGSGGQYNTGLQSGQGYRQDNAPAPYGGPPSSTDPGYSGRPGGSYPQSGYGYEAQRSYDAPRGGRGADWAPNSEIPYDDRSHPNSSMGMDSNARYPSGRPYNVQNVPSNSQNHIGDAGGRRDGISQSGGNYGTDPRSGTGNEWDNRRHGGMPHNNNGRRNGGPADQGYGMPSGPQHHSTVPHNTIASNRRDLGLQSSGYGSNPGRHPQHHQNQGVSTGVASDNVPQDTGAGTGSLSGSVPAPGGVDIGKLTNLISAFQQQVQQGNIQQGSTGPRGNARSGNGRGSVGSSGSVAMQPGATGGAPSVPVPPTMQQTMPNANGAPGPRSQPASVHSHHSSHPPPSHHQQQAPQYHGQGYGAPSMAPQDTSHGTYPPHQQQRTYYGR